MKDTVLIVGAGFSAAAEIPTTGKITEQFLTLQPTAATPDPLQSEISAELGGFWRDVFATQEGAPNPSFEDHFTVLDLAANAGHNLGTKYWPRRLRAIRRLSLHRVFDILDSQYRPNPNITKLLTRLAEQNHTAIVSTNWDVSVESHLEAAGLQYQYDIPVDFLNGTPMPPAGLPVLKLHGSANWCYCDCCRRVYAFQPLGQKGTLNSWTFLEERDFKTLPRAGKKLDRNLWKRQIAQNCPRCNVRLSARVATFSFDKAYGFYQFQGVWERALAALRQAERWVFIGYSLPDADFQLRHMLKTAELADQKSRALDILVVLKNDLLAKERYRKFFGSHIAETHMDGFDSWYEQFDNPLL